MPCMIFAKKRPHEEENPDSATPPLVDCGELISEWKVFRRALCKERDFFVSSMGQSKCPSLQDFIQSLEARSLEARSLQGDVTLYF